MLTPNSVNEPKILPKNIPTVAYSNPTEAPAGTSPIVTVTGTDFIAQCVLVFNGVVQATTFVNTTTLRAKLPVTPAGSYPLLVRLYGAELPVPLPFKFTIAELKKSDRDEEDDHDKKHK
jgi:hypothetical protein